MSANTNKVNAFFDTATAKFGVNRAGVVHRALVQGQITPAVRAEVRKVIAGTPRRLH